jgi:hypothetical protein
MSMGPVEWANEFAATMDDARSLRIMRDMAKRNIAYAVETLDMIGDDPMAASFQLDRDLNQKALAKIEARMEELGLED